MRRASQESILNLAVGESAPDEDEQNSVAARMAPKWPKAVNRARRSRRATSRTRCSPIDVLLRRCVRGTADGNVFPSVGRLPSTASADGQNPSLFGGFLGTTQPSDFP